MASSEPSAPAGAAARVVRGAPAWRRPIGYEHAYRALFSPYLQVARWPFLPSNNSIARDGPRLPLPSHMPRADTMQVPTAKLLRLLGRPPAGSAPGDGAGAGGTRRPRRGGGSSVCDALQDADPSVRVKLSGRWGSCASSRASAAAGADQGGRRGGRRGGPRRGPSRRQGDAHPARTDAEGGTRSAPLHRGGAGRRRHRRRHGRGGGRPPRQEPRRRRGGGAVARRADPRPGRGPAAGVDGPAARTGRRSQGRGDPAPTHDDRAAVVRLLAALDDPRAGAALWDKVLPPNPPEVRAAALQGSASGPPPPPRIN